MMLPRATVRLQLHAGFTLIDACEQVSYYARLGISHFYLSPISQAVLGSTHGYDVIDPGIISRELGGEAAFMELARSLREHGMGIILDIVPNHMATHCTNQWWWDVLRLGPDSAYAEWFDIDWLSPDPALSGKVLAPFLAQDYASSLAMGKLALIFDQPSQSFQIQADGAQYPLAPDSLRPQDASVAQTLARHDPGTPFGRECLHALLQRQHYVLAWWRCAADRINWRRFFEISALIGMRVERQSVFDAIHALPLRLYARGLIDGVRIDHVDGLSQPLAYCRQLKARLEACSAQRPGDLCHDVPWLIIEKILAEDEALDSRWAVQGTTGYDFMNQASALLHDPAGEPALSAHWNILSGQTVTPQELLEDTRRLMLQRHFVAEYQSLLRVLSRLAQSSIATRDWTLAAIDRVLHVMLIVFPVYRTYVEEGASSSIDAALYSKLMGVLRQRLAKEEGASELDLLDRLLAWLGATPQGSFKKDDPVGADLRLEAINRFQQLTPPLAAKSLEDTVFYRYGRLLSRNEVGSSLDGFALSPERFHWHNAQRVVDSPQAMLTTATHDQKRGEDVRARLAVLSEIPELWTAASRRWLYWPSSGNAPCTPDLAAERYMLFQTMVGAWPLDLALDDGSALAHYAERLVQWQTKALREAKTHSSWFEPCLEHERDSADYIRQLMLGPQAGVLSEIEQFVRCIAPAGAVNSFVQIVLRMTVPGVPDLYQGTEFWDFSLVDPDNRRPVDFAARHLALNALTAEDGVQHLVADWRNGHIKQALIASVLRMRCEMPVLFSQGDYQRLGVSGPQSAHILAFLRTSGEQGALVAVPRLCSKAARIGKAEGLPLITPQFWDGTYVALPACAAKRRWRCALTGALLSPSSNGLLSMREILAQLPFAVLRPDDVIS